MCKEKGIEESERCVPIAILQGRKEATKRGRQVMVQKRVDGMLGRTSKAAVPKAFDRLELLRAVTVHIATSDQVSGISPVLR